MEQLHAFSDIQVLNLIGLTAVHANVLRDEVSASYAFRLLPSQVRQLRALALADVAPLLASQRFVSLFQLRADFERLLATPPRLRPLFATLSMAPQAVWAPPHDRRQAPPASADAP